MPKLSDRQISSAPSEANFSTWATAKLQTQVVKAIVHSIVHSPVFVNIGLHVVNIKVNKTSSSAIAEGLRDAIVSTNCADTQRRHISRLTYKNYRKFYRKTVKCSSTFCNFCFH